MRHSMHIKASEIALPVTEQSTDIFIEEPAESVAETLPPVSPPDKKMVTTMKKVVWVCLLNGIAWVWCSYILAWLGKEQIAETLSQVALAEIIGVVLVYAAKSLFENLSKNNSWPDKSGKNPPDRAG